MAESASGISKVFATTTTFIEKAIEFRHFMLVVSFLLALDSCLIVFYDKNLLESFSSLKAPEVNVASALVFLGIFAFLMALMLPAMRLVSIEITRFLLVYLSTLLPERQSEPNHNFVYPNVARTKAIKERDKLLMELVHEHEAEEEHHKVNMNIAFAMVVLFLINSMILGNDHSTTLAQEAGKLPKSVEGFWLNAFIYVSYLGFGAFLTIVLGMSIKPDHMEKMYLPESDVEKQARIEKESARQKRYLG
ncbi:hypothetical protein IFU20_16580 [Pseudomonas viridiflava]|uniref:hypothetical protein n=1 Tax=Pseudomonas viridiflava TaxID=33069 RepID=UPI0017835D65|nr:hypothetical protein [Pseudomonas viridiflava]MBD8187802.1 hypothetical protein [Pseudomonas viridiflava]